MPWLSTNMLFENNGVVVSFLQVSDILYVSIDLMYMVGLTSYRTKMETLKIDGSSTFY